MWGRLAASVGVLGVASGVLAATAPGEESILGAFTDWQAMRYDDGGAVCAMWTDPKPAGRRKAHAFVSHRAQSKAAHEVSVQFGVALKSGSPVEVKIGKQRFKMYAEGDSAWNPSVGEDLRMVNAMRGGATMDVTVTSPDGVTLRDSYSLSGFTAAHKAINEACKVTFSPPK